MDKVTVTTEPDAAEVIVARFIDDWGWGPLEEIEGLSEHILAVNACRAGYTEATRQAEEQIKLLREACERAKGLICAGKGDHPNDAIRESNVNQAWRTLRQALEATNG